MGKILATSEKQNAELEINNEENLLISKMDIEETNLKLNEEKNLIKNLNLNFDNKIPIPGKGRKILFTSINQTKLVRSFIDNGSTTSLCTRKYAEEAGLKRFRTIIPINFSGIFSSIRQNESEIVLIKLLLNDCILLFPVYVVEAIPHNADILIGMDQIGKTIGMNIPIERLGKKPTLSLINTKNEEVVIELKEDDAGRTLSNEIPDLALEVNKDGSKTISHGILINPGGRNKVSETNALLSDQLVENVKLKENVTSSVEEDNSMQEVSFPHSLKGVVLNQTNLNDEVNSPNQAVVRDISLVTSLEINSIKKAIELLNDELNEVINLENEITSLVEGNHLRKNKRKIKAKLSTYKSKQQILILIDDLKKEINKINKKKRSKIRSIQKNKIRKERKIENNELRKVLSNMKRYTLKEKTQFNALLPQNNSIQELTENVSFMELLEKIVDTRITKGSDYKLESKKLFDQVFDERVGTINDKAPRSLENEFINTTLIIAQKKDETIRNKDNPHTPAIWNDRLDKSEIETYIFQSLNLEQESLKNRILKSYPSVLVEDDKQIKYCNATARGEPTYFDIELEDWYLNSDKKERRVKPFYMKRPMRDLLKATNEEMFTAGVGVNNPLLWEPEFVTPSFFVNVKGKWRLVHDYKDLNKITRDIHYPLPRTDYIYECMQNKKYFSVLDLKSGYYQFPVTDRASKLLATISPDGVWKWNGLPLGPKNGPPFFQKVMERILKEGLGIYVLVYIDDIVVFSDNFNDHCEHLHHVLTALKESNLQANINKCKFFLKQFKLLGKIVTPDGIAPDPSLIQSMVDYPRPKSRNHVRSFLALLNYYREHIENFGPLTAPLAELNKDNLIWNADTWKDYHEKCFQDLKKLMLQAPVLAYPDMNKEFHLQTDASLYGAGGILFQFDDKGHRKVVSYASWLFNEQQRKYSTTERELFAIILAIRKWKPFLGYTKFVAETDHQALTGYMKLDDPHGKIARWIVELNQFNFELKYIKGTLNASADALSRCYDRNDSVEIICALETHEFVQMFESNQFAVRPSKILSKCFADSELELTAEFDFEFSNSEVTCPNVINYSLPNDMEWAEAQRQDPDLMLYFRYIEKKEVPEEEKLALEVLKKGKNYFIEGKEGILFHKSKEGMLKKCVPRKFRQLLLEEYHDSKWTGGHLGRDKTIDKIKENFYFKNLYSYVELWVSSCSQCRSIKRNNDRPNIPEGNIIATRPWQLVSIDLWSSKVLSNSGNLYTLTVIDAFTKYSLAIPIANKEGLTIAKALINSVFCIFGYPEKLQSDRGTEFINSTLKEICKLAGTAKIATTAYHPQGNGYVERIHQFFKNALTCYIRYDQKDWDEVLPHIMLIYNTTIHSSLNGYAPSQVMFGRSLNSPTIVGSHVNELELGASAYANRIKFVLNRVQNEVLEAFRTKEAKTALRNLNALRKKEFITYHIGDTVGLRVEKVSDEFKSNKLFPRFQGPYKILRVAQNSKVIYLEDPYGIEVEIPVSANRLIRWAYRGILNNFDDEEDNSIIEKEVFQQRAFPHKNSLSNETKDKNENFLSHPEAKGGEFFKIPEDKGNQEIILPLPKTGEDVLKNINNMIIDNENMIIDNENMIIDIPKFNSKFTINDRVRVLFDNGEYYYGNITKFIDNEKRQVHFDDGDIVEDIEEKELIAVKQKINSKIPNNTDINNPKFISRLNSKNRASGLSRLEMEGFEVYFLSVQDEF